MATFEAGGYYLPGEDILGPLCDLYHPICPDTICPPELVDHRESLTTAQTSHSKWVEYVGKTGRKFQVRLDWENEGNEISLRMANFLELEYGLDFKLKKVRLSIKKMMKLAMMKLMQFEREMVAALDEAILGGDDVLVEVDLDYKQARMRAILCECDDRTVFSWQKFQVSSVGQIGDKPYEMWLDELPLFGVGLSLERFYEKLRLVLIGSREAEFWEIDLQTYLVELKDFVSRNDLKVEEVIALQKQAASGLMI